MRLLLAEDEKELSNALTAILKHNNYSVDAVYNGADALDWALSGQYDGMILDIMMPRKNGLEVLQELRARGNGTPVLMLTAKAEVEDRISGLDLGADDYLPKPFAMGELLARLRAMTRRKAEFAPNRLVFGKIQLDRASFELSAVNAAADGSDQAHLTFRLANKEFQVLEMLMSNPDRLISTEQFMERIWGFDAEAEINVVWVYISNLRKKLAALDPRVTIRASRGAGYMLEKADD
ncbi:response regulator transcription factor [Bacilliculturomica massiliensis]|uniref:response regulator transcription factor n=1 Tax=Bacilliculturomica massiliensis TaxID=1917867 RepID=UPI0010316145|nr:response regulator transcription factor [Bacilliculturomica massiliensis]